jgi:hypothetical protein
LLLRLHHGSAWLWWQISHLRCVQLELWCICFKGGNDSCWVLLPSVFKRHFCPFRAADAESHFSHLTVSHLPQRWTTGDTLVIWFVGVSGLSLQRSHPEAKIRNFPDTRTWLEYCTPGDLKQYCLEVLGWKEASEIGF